MGKMNALSLAEQEDLWSQHEEDLRNELRKEGATEICKLIRYDLLRKYDAAVIFAKPSESRPMAIREALDIVEHYLR